MNTGFRSPKELELALGLPLIALIPILEDRRTRVFKTVNWVATGFALMAACMMFLIFAALALNGVEETLALVTKVKSIFL
jgi:hypothetical protein